MMNLSKRTHLIDDDDDVKIVLPVSSTSTQQLLDVSGNKIGEVELNTFEDFAYASESTATIIERVVWGEQDTTFLLEKYELYICEVGPRKRFHSKKHMWNQIANDIYAKFKLIITGAQCETRYKTVCKRRKQLLDNLKQNNLSTSDEDKNGTTSTTDEGAEGEVLRNEGLQMHFERLEQTNQELTQQIEQCSIRVLTMVERLEKHHTRQQQKFEKTIQENKDQLKSNFTTLFEKLDNIHNSIQKNQEHQQQLLQKLIENRQEEHKKEFATLLNILDKIHCSIKWDENISKQNDRNHSMGSKKQDVIKRSRSRSNSRRKNSKERSSCSSPKTKRRFHSPNTRSRSNSKSNYKSPVLHSSRRSRSNDRYNSSSHLLNIRNRHERRRNSKSRSPTCSNRRSYQESSCKQHDKYR